MSNGNLNGVHSERYPDPEFTTSSQSSPRSESPAPEADSRGGKSSRIVRSYRDRFRRERERAYSTTSSREVLRLLINEEYALKQTRKLLLAAIERVDLESRRAAEAENQIAETLTKFQTLGRQRRAAQEGNARLREELRLHKLQLENARVEIARAQEIVKNVEDQRDDAEESAWKAKEMARKLNEERLMRIARDEGRRLGYAEGVRRGRALAQEDLGDPDGGPATRRIDRVVHRDSQEIQEHEIDMALEDTPPRATANVLMRTVSPPPLSISDTLTNSLSELEVIRGAESRPPPPRGQSRTPRAVSIRGPSPIPPDNWIPSADHNSFIAMPAPHEMSRVPSSPGSTSFAVLDNPLQTPPQGRTGPISASPLPAHAPRLSVNAESAGHTSGIRRVQNGNTREIQQNRLSNSENGRKSGHADSGSRGAVPLADARSYTSNRLSPVIPAPAPLTPRRAPTSRRSNLTQRSSVPDVAMEEHLRSPVVITVEPPSATPSERSRHSDVSSSLNAPSDFSPNAPLPLAQPTPVRLQSMTMSFGTRLSQATPEDPDSTQFSIVTRHSEGQSANHTGPVSGSRMPDASWPPPSPAQSHQGKSKTTTDPYPTAPIPPGFSYPGPPTAPVGNPVPSLASPQLSGGLSPVQRRGRRSSIGGNDGTALRSTSRTPSSSAPAASNTVFPENGEGIMTVRASSRASMGSAGSYDPGNYLDPAFLNDSVTAANTLANSGRPASPSVPASSPALSYVG